MIGYTLKFTNESCAISCYSVANGPKSVSVFRRRSSSVRDFKKENIFRATSRVRNICECTDFQYFYTQTFSARTVDRTDSQAVYNAMSVIRRELSRMKAKYIICLDVHKDGNIHAHGLVDIDKKYLHRAGTYKCGKKYTPQYMIRSFNTRFGRNNFIKIIKFTDSSCPLSRYISKYIIKAAATPLFSELPRFYFRSSGLPQYLEKLTLTGAAAENFLELLQLNYKLNTKEFHGVQFTRCIASEFDQIKILYHIALIKAKPRPVPVCAFSNNYSPHQLSFL